jgi:tetratricopeptide (TPR) repeat protein
MNHDKTQDRGRLTSAVIVAIAFLLAGAAWTAGQPQTPGQDPLRKDGNEPSGQAKTSDLAEAGKLADLLAEELRLAERLVKAFPDKEQPLVLLGSVHSRGGQADQAFACWDKVVQMNPKRPDVYNRMANLALQTDQVDRALALWRKVLELDPAAPQAHYHVAMALMRQGKDKEAIAEIAEETKLFGDRPEDYYVLGQAYQHLEDYGKAKENYLRAVSLEPEHMNAFYGLYGVCARLKQSEEAKRYLERFQKLKERQKENLRKADESMMSDTEIFYDGLAKFFFDAAAFGREAGKNPEVEDVLRKAIGLGQQNAVFLMRLAGLYSASERQAEALALYLKASQIAPKDASCPLNMGILLVRMGRLEKAEPLFRKTIELSPEQHAGYQELARLYMRMGGTRLAEAGQLAQKAVDLEARPDTYFDLGAVRLMNGDAPGARTAINKALELDPGSESARQLLEVIKKKEGGK